MAQQRYTALNGKYLQDAERLLEQGDWPQASEKLWGAVAQQVKAIASARRWRHSSHYDLRQVVNRIYQETGDSELLDLFSIAEALHANFYEDFLTAEVVQHYAEQAKRLIQKLQPLAG